MSRTSFEANGDAAQAVTGASLETLTVLCDAGLLDQPTIEYYTLHALIADYARTQGIETEKIIVE